MLEVISYAARHGTQDTRFLKKENGQGKEHSKKK